jgi:hypothetical protein
MMSLSEGEMEDRPVTLSEFLPAAESLGAGQQDTHSNLIKNHLSYPRISLTSIIRFHILKSTKI